MVSRKVELEKNPNLSPKNVSVVERILSKNDKEAMELRRRFGEAGVYSINLMSSPGSGKTTLLEGFATINPFSFGVIEGDLQTNRDAERLHKKGVRAHQITTGNACHLEASMVRKSLDEYFSLGGLEYLFVENVGNLVCPASYDLGCAMNIILLSVPEGDDKILKYPTMFLCADAVLVTKCDMMDYFGFKMSQVYEDLSKIKPNAPVFELSSKNLDSYAPFINFLKQNKENNYVSSHTF